MEATEALKPMAQRILNAENGFVEVLQGIVPMRVDQARKVMAFYLKQRIAKLDTGIGRISVVHGIYLDRQSVLNAMAMCGAA